MSLSAHKYEFIELWPDAVPGQTAAKAPPHSSVSEGDQGTYVGPVTNPALIVYEAAPELRNGAAVIVCPGGGYNILAFDKEGTEIAEWLNALGYTAFVLQYRIPKNRAGALQDAQRALRIVRSQCAQWGVEADKIGVLGFSAGGSLSARLSTRYHDELYPPIDAADTRSARPDFAVLIYPAYLDEGPDKRLTPELKLTENTPPMFLYVAGDDPYANSSLVMSAALLKAGIPFELHMLPKGGHGFGMRSGNAAAETWPALCAKWLRGVL